MFKSPNERKTLSVPTISPFFVKNMCDLSVPYNTTKFYFQLISSEIIVVSKKYKKK